MKLMIHKDDSSRILALLQAIMHEFPESSHELLEVAAKARDGITVEIEPYVPDHTTPQRGYYWKWNRAFAEWVGMTPDEMHEQILRHAYGSEVHETRMGPVIRPTKRSSEANRTEYSLLIDTLIRVAAEMGFDIPPPQREMFKPPQEKKP